MNFETISKLSEMTQKFYANNTSSFSQTRQYPWQGWLKLLPYTENVAGKNTQDVHFLDLACGNMRFEKFIAQNLVEFTPIWHTLDSCDFATTEKTTLNKEISNNNLFFIETDILHSLQQMTTDDARTNWQIPPCAGVFSFGFFHHIPSFALRTKVLNFLIDSCASNGIIALSFWQFMNEEKIAHKALTNTEKAKQELGFLELESDDYLLGWQNKIGEYRYCHNFSDDELTQLLQPFIDTKKVKLIATYSADGKSNNLNKYIILQKI